MLTSPPDLQRRLAVVIAAGQPFTIDDVTDDGEVTLDDQHRPNARNSAIGPLVMTARLRGHIAHDGSALSRSPRRHRSLVNQWRPTPAGMAWARQLLLDRKGRAR